MKVKDKIASFLGKVIYGSAMRTPLQHSANVLITQKMIESLYTPHAVQSLATLSKAFRHIPRTAQDYANVMHDNANILRFLQLVRPYVSDSIKLVRIGAHTDGGYLMLPPPFSKS